MFQCQGTQNSKCKFQGRKIAENHKCLGQFLASLIANTRAQSQVLQGTLVLFLAQTFVNNFPAQNSADQRAQAVHSGDARPAQTPHKMHDPTENARMDHLVRHQPHPHARADSPAPRALLSNSTAPHIGAAVPAPPTTAKPASDRRRRPP